MREVIYEMGPDELLIRASECWEMAIEHLREQDYHAAARSVRMANLYQTRFAQLMQDEDGGGNA